MTVGSLLSLSTLAKCFIQRLKSVNKPSFLDVIIPSDSLILLP